MAACVLGAEWNRNRMKGLIKTAQKYNYLGKILTFWIVHKKAQKASDTNNELPRSSPVCVVWRLPKLIKNKLYF